MSVASVVHETGLSSLSQAQLSAALRQARRATKASRAPGLSAEEQNELGWRTGVLRHLLSPEQVTAYDAFWSGDHSQIALHWSRRMGKDHLCVVISCEVCLLKASNYVVYTHPHKEVVLSILEDTLENYVLPTCPPDLRPKWRRWGSKYLWPNGSEIRVRPIGTKREIKGSRGPRCALLVYTEAGFADELEAAETALQPMLAKQWPGREIYQSNAADNVDHYFFKIVDRLDPKGAAFVQPIHDSTRFSEEEIAELCEKAGGADSEKWRAEFECERIVDTDRAIVPEWRLHRETLIEDIERPRYVNTCLALDLGWHPDHTFAVLGYYHFERGLMVIEDELEISQMTTDVLAEQLEELETRTYGDYWAWVDRWHPPKVVDEKGKIVTQRGPVYHSRWQDVHKQVQADLSRLHSLPINQAHHSLLEAKVNRLRVAVRTEQLRIHPRCTRTIANLDNGLWNRSRTDFDRRPGFGHFDGVAAACIYVAHIDRTSNPVPTVPIDARLENVVYPAQEKPKSDFVGFRRRKK